MKRRILASAGQDEGRPVSIPAPTGGWNASDPISKMKPTDAVYLDNFFPEASDVALRKGYALHCTITADTVLSPHNIRSLMGYSPPSGSVKIFAGCEAGVYDVTAAGTQLSIASVATSGQWESVNITTAGGNFLWMCNAVDKCKLYNGTTWVNLDGASVPAITGLTSTTVANVSLHKKRLIACVTGSLSFYYLGTNAISGAFTEFPLGALFAKGGYLMATASWTVDAGDGSDDFFVAITSEGEVAVYRGIDPASEATWALVGVYFLGRPLNRKCFTKLGGDLAVMTHGGLLPLSKALQSSSLDRTFGLTRKIHKAYTDYVSSYSSLFGWQMVVFPEGPFVLVNVPILDDTTKNIIYSYQFVMNNATGAWCRFTAMNAACWLAFNGKLYFAAHNKVYEAWTGETDNTASIQAKGKTAFNYLSSGRAKYVSLVRPVISTNLSVNVDLGIDMDYASGSSFSSSSSYIQALSVWDTALWGTATFAGSSSSVAKWRTVPAKTGRAVSIRLRVTVKNATMSWNAVDLIVKDGGLM